jgi:hypothetical protein
LDLGVQLHSSISEHGHRKSIPDGSANVVTGNVEKGCKYGYHVLYLAQVHPKPLTMPPTKMYKNSNLLHYQQKPSLATELT